VFRKGVSGLFLVGVSGFDSDEQLVPFVIFARFCRARLADGFRRIFGTTIFFRTCKAEAQVDVLDCVRLHFFERMRLWFRPDPSSSSSSEPRKLVTLSEAFWEENPTYQ